MQYPDDQPGLLLSYLHSLDDDDLRSLLRYHVDVLKRGPVGVDREVICENIHLIKGVTMNRERLRQMHVRDPGDIGSVG